MTGMVNPAVVPADVLLEGPPQIPFAGDQHQVGDLDPGGEPEPIRVSVPTGCGRARPEHRSARPGPCSAPTSGPRVSATRCRCTCASATSDERRPAPLPRPMRALRFTEFGRPAEALASAQVAVPPVTPDESLVQVHPINA
jgi:hypothetical protein